MKIRLQWVYDGKAKQSDVEFHSLPVLGQTIEMDYHQSDKPLVVKSIKHQIDIHNIGRTIMELE